MNKYYLCPECRGHLKVGDYIIFTAANKHKNRGMLLLHPEIGNYTSIKHPSFTYDVGDPVDFFCPLCSASLQTSLDKNLVRVVMIDQDDREYDIYFSRIAGEESTYQVAEDTSVMAAGEHSSRYTHFRIPEEMKKFLRK